jgi:hypothetical protein
MKGDIFMKKFKISKEKILSGAAVLIGIIGMLLSNKVAENERNAMKKELKEELMKEISSEQK